jgi:hypothetical protein
MTSAEPADVAETALRRIIFTTVPGELLHVCADIEDDSADEVPADLTAG